VGSSPLLLGPFIGLLYPPWMIDCYECEAISGMNEWQGKPAYSEWTFPRSGLSTTDPTRLDPWSNPAHNGGKPATDRLS
jgi:hypothetical protein